VKIDPTYSKGFFRRAVARKELKRYQLALDDLNRALELEPGNKQVAE
jgi:tetratricopeptide (TPR) repeat protein